MKIDFTERELTILYGLVGRECDRAIELKEPKATCFTLRDKVTQALREEAND